MNRPRPGKADVRAGKREPPLVDWAVVPDGSLMLVDTAPLIYFLEDNIRFAGRFLGLFESAAARVSAMAIPRP